MKGRPVRYSHEELAWLSDNRTMFLADYHAAFCVRFGRVDVEPPALHALRKRKKWKNC